jgi:hypothetical protein
VPLAGVLPEESGHRASPASLTGVAVRLAYAKMCQKKLERDELDTELSAKTLRRRRWRNKGADKRELLGHLFTWTDARRSALSQEDSTKAFRKCASWHGGFWAEVGLQCGCLVFEVGALP